MTGTREQILGALFTLWTTLPGLAQVPSRRLVQAPMVPPETTPAMYQIEEDETPVRHGVGTPPIRYLTAQLWFYGDAGQPDPSVSTTPGGTLINNWLDTVEAALKPDNLQRGVLTLGNLCHWCRFEGRVVKVGANWGTIALGIAKVRILMP